jgi:hypothetical protein
MEDSTTCEQATVSRARVIGAVALDAQADRGIDVLLDQNAQDVRDVAEKRVIAVRPLSQVPC